MFAAFPALGLADEAQPVAGSPYTRPAPAPGSSWPDCFCTDSDGQRVELGERACLTIGPRKVTALCDMSLNNPTWRTEAEGCPTS